MHRDQISYQELKEKVQNYLDRQNGVAQTRPGTALPCCRVAQSFPNGIENYTGIMQCVKCGRLWNLTRKAGALRVIAM
jgi:hypothetical protein